MRKLAFDGVRAEARRMRSPSFSREGESRTMMKLPFSRDEKMSQCE